MHRIVSGGRIVSGCSCYASKHKIVMGKVVPLTRDKQYEDSLIAKKINFCSRQSCKFILNLITNAIAWLWNNQIWIILVDND